MRNLFLEMVHESLSIPGTALADENMPASGAFNYAGIGGYIGYMVNTGAVADDVVFEILQADAIDGTPKSLSPAVTITLANATDDNGTFFLEIRPEQLDLANGYHYTTLNISGNSGTNAAYVSFVAWNIRHKPAIQPANFTKNVLALQGLAEFTP